MSVLPDKAHQITISTSSIFLTIASILGLLFLFQIQEILVLLFLAFIVMTALHPWVDMLHKRLKLPRSFAIVLVYVFVITFFSILLWLMVPPLGTQLFQLIQTLNLPLPQYWLNDLKFTFAELSTLFNQLSDSVMVFLTFVSSTASTLFNFFTLIFLSLFLMIERPELHKKIGWFTDKARHFEVAETFLNETERQLGGWVRGQILLMLLIGIITYIGLSLLGVPYAVPLALIAGLLEIVPNLGPFAAGITAAIVAFLSSGSVLMGFVILFYVVLQQFENNLIVPKIMKESAGVNPLVSMTAILIGLKLGGIAGAFLGVPAYILLRVTYSTWRKEIHLKK